MSNIHRAGALNAPTTTNKTGKRDLLDPARRVWALIRWSHRLGIDVLGLQEVGTITRTIFRLHPRWRYLPASPNTVTRINRKGNALALRRNLFPVIQRRAIRVPYAKAFGGALKLPRVLTADKNTSQRTLWIVPHAPRRSEPVAQRKVWAHVAAACQAAINKNIAVVVLPDTNGLQLAKEILGRVGMRLVISADVEAIFVSENVKVRGKGVQRDGIANVISDHRGGLPWADLELDESVDISASRIPV